jgi:ubiquinone biosynthesis UbiH/UbiF/VisC/COQ6 family hydroxylase
MRYDVVIAGAGPAGLCFAKMLALQGLKILVVERESEEALADPAYDGREIALTHKSYNLLKKYEILKYIPESALGQIKDAKVFNRNLSRPLFFDHQKSGKEHLGYILSNHLIRKAAYDAIKTEKSITLLERTSIQQINNNSNQSVVILNNNRTVKTALVIGADGRFSETRRMMGIPTDIYDFGRTCLLGRMEMEKDHDSTAYEYFFHDMTLAILPLQGHFCSVVITLPTTKAKHLQEQSIIELAADIEGRIKHKFGLMKFTTSLYSYPLVSTYAKSFYAENYALIGDAAVGMHPVTAHGFNLGLQGAHTLAQEIKNGYDAFKYIGDETILRQYTTIHRRTTLALYHGTNALVRLYTRETIFAKIVRSSLLALVQHMPPAKRFIISKLV